MSRIQAAAICLLLATGAAFTASAAFTPPAELRVATDLNYPPYFYRTDDGVTQGILIDKWGLWSSRTGVKVRVLGMDWSEAQKSVRNGTNDILDPLSFTEGRASLYEFSRPYAEVEARVYFHRSISGINDLPSMRGFRIGAKEGSACGGWLADHKIDTLKNYPTSEQLVKAAGAGEIRLFCMDSVAARYFLFKSGVAEDFRETPPLYQTNFHWAVARGRAELRDFIQQGFDRIPAEELAEIDTRWIGHPVQSAINPRMLAYVGIAVAVLLGLAVLLAIWNRSLQGRVASRTAEVQRAMALIKADAERIQDLYNRAPCGYHSLDMNGMFVSINDTELAWLGYSREELLGKRKFSEFLNEKSQRDFTVNYANFVRNGEIHDVEYDLRRRDGSALSILLSATMVRDDNGINLMSRATLHDVTERKQAQDKVRQLNAELEQRIEERTEQLTAANKELAAFSYSLSHDLRAPLRTIDGFSHLLLDDYAGVVDERGRDFLHRLRRASQRIGLLIDDMLKLSRVSFAGLHVTDVDVSRLASDILGELARAHPERSVAFDIAAGITLRGDAGLIRIIMENLLGNAWKYTSRNPQARIEVGAAKSGAGTTVHVRDNGVGFDMRYAGKLFEPFQRLHDVKEFEGTGIGLATVQRVINRHRGRVWAESEVGKGTTVFFTLGA